MADLDSADGAAPASGSAARDPELEALARDVDQDLKDPAPGADPRAARPAPVNLETELAGMFALIGGAVGQFLPSVATVLEEKTCEQLGQVLAPLARKYGIDRHLQGFAWRLELQAIFVVVPVGMAIAGAVRHDLAKHREAAAAAGGAGLGAETPAPRPAPAAAPGESPPAAAEASPAKLVRVGP